MRLDKLVSHGAGISRKQSAKVIRDRRVSVNGEITAFPESHCCENDFITLDNVPISIGNRYYMLNKPKGVICATKDLKTPTVIELLPAHLRKGVFPAGRLDKDTEGFVLLTNDGILSHQILSPKKKIGKTYHATLDSGFSLELLRSAFYLPMDLGNGDITSPAQIQLLKDCENPIVELTIYEGRYHQVKRMFAAFNLNVIHLKRTAIGNLILDDSLAPGGWKPLDDSDLNLIFS